MGFRSIKSLFFIVVLAVASSCGKDAEQETKDAILSANIYLSTKQCQPAIDLLESIGRKNTNAYYLKVLSSAYACRAGYSTTVLFATDLEKTANPGPLGGMATYTTSTGSTVPLTDDLKFRDLQTAIDILLYAGGLSSTTEPTAANRATKFSADYASEINTQIAFMMMAQTGKFFKVYANADSNGVKSLGSASNDCFTDYSNISMQAEIVLTNQQGHCTVKNSPHIQLDSALVSVAERRKRMCEGVVLINGIIDLLPSIIIAAGGDDLEDLETILDDIKTGRATIEAAYPAIGAIMNVVSQTNCENNPAITTAVIESYYATVVEGLIE